MDSRGAARARAVARGAVHHGAQARAPSLRRRRAASPARGGATADDMSDDGGADDGGADDGGADDAPPASLADDASTPGVRCAAVR